MQRSYTIREGIEQVATLKDPIGEVQERRL